MTEEKLIKLVREFDLKYEQSEKEKQKILHYCETELKLENIPTDVLDKLIKI